MPSITYSLVTKDITAYRYVFLFSARVIPHLHVGVDKQSCFFCLDKVRDILPYSFAYNFFVLSLRACNAGSQFSKYSVFIISLPFLSAKTDCAYPKSWQRQVLLTTSIVSVVTVRRLLNK